MKILHIWNQAGVASILAKYQRKLGHEAEVIKRGGFDCYGIEEFYGTTIYRCRASKWYYYAVKKCREFDIIHVHSLSGLVPFIRKPKVLHFHGDDLRQAGFWRSIRNYIARKLVDRVLVATPDLLSVLADAEWLRNPVDMEHCYPRKTPVELSPLPKYSVEKGRYENVIPYSKLPVYLSQQKRIVQAKINRSLSKLSLDALACGVDVVWNGLLIKGVLPDIHRAENVAKRTIRIYEDILNDRL